MGFGQSYVPSAEAPVSPGVNWKAMASIAGMGAQYAGGFLGLQAKYGASKWESELMGYEANITRYNADLARWEEAIAKRETDIEIDLHRERVDRILGKQATYYAWGNIRLDDPEGTPAQVRLKSLYNAEYNEGIIVERGWIRRQRAKHKADVYKYKAATIEAARPGIMAGARMERLGGLLTLTGKLAGEFI